MTPEQERLADMLTRQDFRLEYEPGVSCDLSRRPVAEWTDEYLVWFYWTRCYDETLPFVYTVAEIGALRRGNYWRLIEVEMANRKIPMHVSELWSAA